VTAFATLLTPMSYGSAIELGNRLWRKKVLPVGDIEYQGRQLHFTRPYLAGLATAFRDRAYDQVSFQLADSANTHTNDPERHRGTIVDMQAEPDGLYITLDPTERGEQVLRENPYLGVSARIVEQYQRSDGKFYPAAVQHVLGTLDPRIPGLGAWQPIEMSNESSVVIDLSGYSFAGEPAPTWSPTATADPFEGLSDRELGDLLDVMDEVGLLDDEGDQMYDDAGYQAAAEQFDSAFTARAQAEQDRQDAISAAIVEDTLHPARRDEDKIARIMRRAADGVYSGQQADFTAEAAAVEILMSNGGHGACGVTDSYGRCAERYHQLGCSHDQGTDWLASGPPRSTYAASLANWAAGLSIDLAPRAVFDDPDDDDQPPQYMPAATVELAHSLAHEWGLDASAPGGFTDTAPGWQDLLRGPAAPVTAADVLYEAMGVEQPQPERLSYPGVKEIRARMGL
jgi:hypothetical protein